MMNQYFFSKSISFLLLFLFYSSITKAQNKAVDSLNYFIENVQIAFDRGDDNLAIALSEKAIRTYPDNDSLVGIAQLILGKVYFRQKQYGASAQKFNTAINNLIKNDGHPLIYEAYFNLGILYRLKRDYKNARDYFLKAIDVVEHKYPKNHNSLIDIYKELCRIEKSTANYDSGLLYADKFISLSEYHDNAEQKAIAITHKADILQLQRNFNEAIENYLESIRIKEKLFGAIYRGNVVSYTNLAGAYGQIGYFDKAIEYQKRAITVNEKLASNNRSTNTIAYSNLGAYYTESDRLDEAVESHQKALILLEEEFGNDHPLFPVFSKNFGDAYYDLEDYENAKKQYKASVNFIIQKYGDKDEDIAESYLNLGAIAKAQNDLSLAQSYIEKAMRVLPQNHFQKIESQLKLAEVFIAQKNIESAQKLLNNIESQLPIKEYKALNIDQLRDRKQFYATKIKYFEMIGEKQVHSVDSLSSYYAKIYEIDNYTIHQYTTASSKEFQLKKIFPVYEDYIQHIINTDLHDGGATIFEILEKTKARKLLENFKKNKSIIKSTIPDSLLKREKKLRLDLIYYEQLKQDLAITDKDENDSINSAYDTKIFDLKRSRDILQEEFKVNYPPYYDLVYNQEVVSIEDIQKNLKNDESLVEYYVGEENIYIVLITQEDYEIKQIARNFPLKSWIQKLRGGIYDYWSMSSTSDEDLEKNFLLYKSMAYKLYNKLLKPIEKKLTKKIRIVPDGELNFIPFDALLTHDINQDVSNNGLPYVLKKYNISYAHSATLLNQIKIRENRESNDKVIAFAPEFKGGEVYETIAMRRSGLGKLKYNIPEVEAISDLMNTDIYRSDAATKANFIEHSKEYKIIHLSTHAKTNDKYGDYSYIAFDDGNNTTPETDNKLYVKELYGLDLNAEMVVLSACETGVGEIKRGEGVISLARAFTYAGANSTITSLWNVNDAQTSKLMKLFYINIKEGLPKDEALHKAKLSYIKDEELTAPYFWAAFIPTGNMEPIVLANSNSTYLIFGIILLLLLSSFFIYKSKLKESK